MKDALFLTSDEQREAREALFRADMAQLDEPDHLPGEPAPGRSVAYVILSAAVVLICAAFTWII